MNTNTHAHTHLDLQTRTRTPACRNRLKHATMHACQRRLPRLTQKQMDTQMHIHTSRHAQHTQKHTPYKNTYIPELPHKKKMQTDTTREKPRHTYMHKHACTTHTQTDTQNTYCGLHKHMGTTQISTHITHRHRGVQIDIHLHPWGWVEETALGETLFPLRLLPKGISLEGCGDLLLNTQCCTVPVQGCYPKHLLDPRTLPFLYSSSSHSCSSS